MFDAETIQKYILVLCALFLTVAIFFCLLRAALGSRFSDRMTAANMIGVKIILLISVLAMIIGQNYLADICLIYAIINFLSVAVLLRSVNDNKKEENGE